MFIEELYVHPNEKDKNVTQEKNTQEEAEDDVDINLEFSSYSTPITIDDFYNDLRDNNSIEPLFIRGNSGTGKTTFINANLYFLEKSDKRFYSVYINLQETKEDVNFFNFKWNNEKIGKTIYKLYSVFIECIDSLINKYYDEDEGKYIKRLSFACKNFKNIF